MRGEDRVIRSCQRFAFFVCVFLEKKEKRKEKKRGGESDDVDNKCCNVNYSAPWVDMVTLNASTVTSFGLKGRKNPKKNSHSFSKCP